VIGRPNAAEQLERLTAAIHLADPPALFTVWQDGAGSMRLFVDALVQAGLTTPHVIRPPEVAAKLKGLEQRSSLLSEDEGAVFLGCLSALAEEERILFNACRDRLLLLRMKMVFVESVADERKVRLGLPDVLSQVSYDCRLFQLASEEDPFATSAPLQQDPDAGNQTPGGLSGTVLEVGADEAVCWLEVGPGVRVRFSVPLSQLRHLDPQPGLELLWSPGREGDLPEFRKREPEPPDPNLLREFEELSRRFHEDLKHREKHLPQDP
jgi:hypothetical protein